ncbi:MAG: NUDIX hydrolase [Proteobacteria bacterium]|nr:NUDIX hydrolase [Pseudomonadota bacterium]
MHLLDKKTILTTIPFQVEEIRFEAENLTPTRPYHRIHCPDWVNILPILADGRAVLIEQPRVGSMSYILETPGGVIDPEEKDATMAALRELEEETGLTSQRILSLASFNPNPAIMTNNCHFFLALGCIPALNRRHFPDSDESIKLRIVSTQELEDLVRTRQINHALSALGILLAQKYLQ